MNFNWVLEMTSFSKMVKGSKKYHLSVSGIPDLAIQAKDLRDDNGLTTECSAFFPIEKRSECSCLEGGGEEDDEVGDELPGTAASDKRGPVGDDLLK